MTNPCGSSPGTGPFIPRTRSTGPFIPRTRRVFTSRLFGLIFEKFLRVLGKVKKKMRRVVIAFGPRHNKFRSFSFISGNEDAIRQRKKQKKKKRQDDDIFDDLTNPLHPASFLTPLKKASLDWGRSRGVTHVRRGTEWDCDNGDDGDDGDD